MEERNDFVTYDVSLAAFLWLYLKTEPSYQTIRGRKLFAFEKSDSLYSAMQAFNNGAMVPALEYSLAVKKLRDEIFGRGRG